MKNNNSKVVRKLSFRSLRANHMRNIFAILAIALTTLLFTALFTIGEGMLQLNEEQTMRQVGTSAHAGLKDVTKEQYDTIRQHSLVVDSSSHRIISMAKNKELIKRMTQIEWTEEANLKSSFIELAAGRLPEKENEIVLDDIVMQMLGIEKKLGSPVTLEFDFLYESHETTFELCGWFEGDSVSGASYAYVSWPYFQSLLHGVTDEELLETCRERESMGEASGLIQGNINFKNSFDIEGNVRRVIEESGYIPGNGEGMIDYGINWAYFTENMNSLDAFSVILLVVVLAVMLITGYLIIYNIFQISIVKDIRFYGLLKTVGTTKKQIKRMVLRQALLLSGIGIPLGLFAGYLVGIVLLPVFFGMMEGLNAKVFHMTFHPMVFLFSALFSFVTVMISCFKPGRLAGSISPIEAEKFGEQTKGKKERKKKKATGIAGMALGNLKRNRKKSTIVILSLSLSVVLMTEVITFAGSFSADKYLESYLLDDFMLGTASLYNPSSRTRDYKLDEDYVSQMLGQKGIERVDYLYESSVYSDHYLSEEAKSRYQELYEAGKLDTRDEYTINNIMNVLEKGESITEQRYAYNNEMLKKLDVIEGTFDYEKFIQGGYVLVATVLDDPIFYKPGEKITLSYHTEESEIEYTTNDKGEVIDYEWKGDKEKEYEVMAVVELPTSMTERSYALNGITTILPYQELLTEDINAILFGVGIMVEDSMEATFEEFIHNYTTKIDPNMDYTSKESLRGEFEETKRSMVLIGSALAFVIAIIGVLNFINTMLTNVVTRRRELAMLQSIGMTNQQLRKLLLYEGFYYVGFTAVVSLILGSVLSMSLIRGMQSIVAYFEYHFTLVPYLSIIPVFILIASIVPLITYQSVKKMSLIERLREIQ